MKRGPLVAVDIGNSSTKLGWFEEQSAALSLPLPARTAKFKTGDSPTAEAIAALPGEICRWEIASVHREGSRLLLAWLAANRPEDEVKEVTAARLPIVARVDHPKRVGVDRLAAAVAANVLRTADRAAIVVGAGSAITVDLIAPDGAFAGGAILPGFRMSAEALFGADLLPLAVLAPNDAAPPVVGTNTEAAICSGLFWGAVGGVREIVSRMARSVSAPPHIYVTGGDLRQFAKHLGGEASFVPNMVLSGIAVAARLQA